jgi:hypothetical protein
MTRSPNITRDLALLRDNPEPVVYFTVTPLASGVREQLEPKSPSNAERICAIQELVSNGICTHIYLNPVIPHIANIEHILRPLVSDIEYVDIESINPMMTITADVLSCLDSCGLDLPVNDIRAVLTNKGRWDSYWADFRQYIDTLFADFSLKRQIFLHPFSEYFGVLDYRQKQ